MQIHTFEAVSTFIELALALWLYCQALPQREGFSSRVGIALVCDGVLMALSVHLGFSFYPPLTDDASFVRAALTFALMLGFMTATAMLCWQSSIWTALFCSSSAYLLQNLATSIERVLHLVGIVPIAIGTAGSTVVPVVDIVTELASVAVVYGIVYLLFMRRITAKGLDGINVGPMFFVVLVTILVTIVFDLALKDLPTLQIPWRYPVVLSVVHLAICSFILFAEFEVIYNRSLRESVATMERVMSEQERQYALSQQTVDAINRRVHNIRHHVFSILMEDGYSPLDREKLRQIAREIQVYDAKVKTGNVALDVVLSEKGLICQQKGIPITCVADGHALDFMASSDIYTLFGTAVDGAIFAVQDIDESNRQAISLNVRDAMGMASISVEHYLIEADKVDAQKEKAGEQALETIRSIVERYGGTFVVGGEVDKDVFHFDALIPIP